MDQAAFEKLMAEAGELRRAELFDEALAKYEKLTRHRPRSIFVWMEYGCAAAATHQLDLAERAWLKVRELGPNDPEVMNNLGHIYSNIRQPEMALACFESAAALAPDAINPRVALATIYEQQSRFEDARSQVDKCLLLDSKDDQARYLDALLDRREKKVASAERKLRGLMASEPTHQFVRYACRYELAQILDQTERFDEAMELLKVAKDIVGSLVDSKMLTENYDCMANSNTRVANDFPKDILRKWSRQFPPKSRYKLGRVAFLGGHPRSGTTLLEQILGSHPEVAAVDESAAFGNVLLRSLRKSPQLSPPRLNVIRRLYIEAMKREFGAESEGKLLLDKNPSPTAMLPLFLKVFPELRVIIALRDPRDVVLSCYFQNIPLNQVNANFLSFERIAKHYADLMNVWLTVREWDSLEWVETRYEDVVSDFEREASRVTTFLGLKWNSCQALFDKPSAPRQVHSPTYHEVTKPIYSRAVARWESYINYLDPVLPMLEPFCKKFGYS